VKSLLTFSFSIILCVCGTWMFEQALWNCQSLLSSLSTLSHCHCHYSTPKFLEPPWFKVWILSILFILFLNVIYNRYKICLQSFIKLRSADLKLHWIWVEMAKFQFKVLIFRSQHASRAASDSDVFSLN